VALNHVNLLLLAPQHVLCVLPPVSGMFLQRTRIQLHHAKSILIATTHKKEYLLISVKSVILARSTRTPSEMLGLSMKAPAMPLNHSRSA